MITQKEAWNLHNEAMDIQTFAKIGYDPRYPDKVYSEEDKLHEYEKALEMEKRVIALIQARYDQTHDDGDKLIESIFSRSTVWTAIKAEKYDEAEKIALTALARGVHPEEKQRLYKALIAAVSKQGFLYGVWDLVEQKEHELATV